MPKNLTGDQVSEETRSINYTNGVKIIQPGNTGTVDGHSILAVNGDIKITAKTHRGDEISSEVTIPQHCFYPGCFSEITVAADSTGEAHVYKD